MMLNYLFLFLLSFKLIANIEVMTPLDGAVTQNSTIQFRFKASDNKGFLMIQDQIVPVRKAVQSLPLELNLGENNIFIYVLNDNRQIQFDISRSIKIFRSLKIEDVISFQERYVLTDLTRRFNLNLVIDKKARMDQPILKKDLYAFLMWFYLDRLPNTLSVTYLDMDIYSNYLSLYQYQESILPEPRLSNFYPDSFVTAQQMIELLMSLKGNYRSLSDQNIMTKKLNIPVEVKSYVPDNWKQQNQFVSRKEVLDLFFRYFDRGIDRNSRNIVIDWPRYLDPSLDDFSDFSGSVADLGLRVKSLASKIKLPNFERPLEPNGEKDIVANINQGPKIKEPLSDSSREFRFVEVKKGDSLPKISKRFLGTSKRWRDIVILNELKIENVTINQQVVSKVDIFPGQKLKLPEI